MNLLTYFPENYTPLPYQVDILTKTSQALDGHVRYIIVAAPTGTGKSFIAKCIANKTDDHSEEFKEAIDDYAFNDISSNNGAFILTVTKQLQDQYQEIFNDIKLCKGKQNFKCKMDKADMTCDIGMCLDNLQIKTQCLVNDACPYYYQKKRAMQSRITALNYEQYFSLENCLNKRDVIICDEASELEAKLVEYGTLKIDTELLHKQFNISLKTFPTTETMLNWVDDIGCQLKDWIDNNKSKLKSDKSVRDKYVAAQKLDEKIELVQNCWNSSDYILTHEIHTKVWIFTPTYIKKHAELIFKNAKTVILMSATIIDPETFAKTLGIDNYKFIEVKSVFDPKKAPIYISDKVKLNYSNLKQMLPTIVNMIKTICEHYKDKRGIIHTHTQYIADFIKANYSSDRLLVRTDKISNEAIMNIHEQCKNSILVSPSLTHGVDLKDDLARFQIIVKVPWLPLGNDRIKKLASIDQRWYVSQMFSTLIQACGRGVRTKDDWCDTYILDGSIIRLIHQYKDMLSEYFVQRIH